MACISETDLNVAEHLFKTYYPKPCEIYVIIVSNAQRKL